MVTVHLHKLIMYGFHGVYRDEHKTGNNYELNLDVTYEEKGPAFHGIRDVISYEDLFAIVKKIMQSPAELLEQLGENIILNIKQQYPPVSEICVSIYKLQPPIENLQGKVGVTLRKKFDD